MRSKRHRVMNGRTMFALALAVMGVRASYGTTLRVVEYNIDDSDQGNNDNITGPNNGVGAIMQAIGEQYVGTDAQPIDVLALTEMLDTNNNSISSTTLPALTNVLNSIYGAGTYAYSSTPDPTSGGTQYNGPCGLIYNTHTVQLLGATALLYNGDGGASGINRAPMRYELAPVGYGSAADFYMYVDHYKADSGTTDENERNEEAQEVRANADALGSSAHIIYTGDMNLVAGAAEPAYKTITAAGPGRAYDPTTSSFVSTWTTGSSTYRYLYSDATNSDDYGLDARFDVQLVTNAMLTQPGVQLAVDTSDPYDPNDFPSSKYLYAEEIFGNNGSTPEAGSTNLPGNTSLNDLNTPSNPNESTTILNDLMQPYGSDHLPIIGDYNVIGVIPLPATWDLSTGGTWNQAASWASGLAPNVAGETVNFAGGINGAAIVTLDGAWTAGTVTFSNTNSYTLSAGSGGVLTMDNAGSPALISDLQGNHAIAAPLVLNSPTVFSFANSGSVLTISGPISGSGVVTVSGPGTLRLGVSSGTTSLNSLSVVGGGTLDIANNTLAINYGSPGNDPIAAIQTLLSSGYAGGAWTGTGINSSVAATGSSPNLSVGYADGNTDTGTAAGPNQILVKYTLAGDANLDGKVDFPDLGIVGQHLNTTGNDWAQGNFTYDPNGAVTFTDLGIVGQNLNKLLTPAGSSGEQLGGAISLLNQPAYSLDTSTQLPDPSVVPLVLATGAALLARRRKRPHYA